MDDLPDEGDGSNQLPAQMLCNQFNNPNPIYGKGALGNQNAGKMYYSGGDSKRLVEILQRMLLELGYDLGTSGPGEDGVDGIFGDRTEEAVLDFQEVHRNWDGDPLKVDGLVGPRTSDALNRSMVGKWYNHYQTPEELVNGKPYHSVTSAYLTEGLLIEPETSEDGRVFIVDQMPWRAFWERSGEAAKMGDKRMMILSAPGLTAGQEVVFRASQEVDDKKIAIDPPVTAISEDGRAEGKFKDWYSRDRVTHYVKLVEGIEPDDFPSVKFTFVAEVAGRTVSSKALLYSGSLSTKLFQIVDEKEVALSDVEYVLYSPWGQRTGTTDEDGGILVDGLPPGGTSIAIDGQVVLSDI